MKYSSYDETRTVVVYDGSGRIVKTRPYTTAENAAADASAADAAKRAVSDQLQTDTTTDLVRIRAAIDALAVLLGDTATVGSIRATIGATADPAGTGTLRALRAQSASSVVTAASIKALIDRCIDLAQRQIDDAQATRRIARQTLRLARLQTGDCASADVGADV